MRVVSWLRSLSASWRNWNPLRWPGPGPRGRRRWRATPPRARRRAGPGRRSARGAPGAGRSGGRCCGRRAARAYRRCAGQESRCCPGSVPSLAPRRARGAAARPRRSSRSSGSAAPRRGRAAAPPPPGRPADRADRRSPALPFLAEALGAPAATVLGLDLGEGGRGFGVVQPHQDLPRRTVRLAPHEQRVDRRLGALDQPGRGWSMTCPCPRVTSSTWRSPPRPGTEKAGGADHDDQPRAAQLPQPAEALGRPRPLATQGIAHSVPLTLLTAAGLCAAAAEAAACRPSAAA